MIALSLAQELKEAGLVWMAATNDFFGIPDRGMDDRVFVLADLQAQLDIFRGWPVVTFHGTAEWALDYILTSEVIWLPREDQLHQMVMELLPKSQETKLIVESNSDQICLKLNWHREELQFKADSIAEAYGKALLFLLGKHHST